MNFTKLDFVTLLFKLFNLHNFLEERGVFRPTKAISDIFLNT